MYRTVNTSDTNLLNSPTLARFKLLLDKDKVTDIISVQTFKPEREKRANIILTQLRNICSDLNLDLHHDHIIDNPSCCCSNPLETVFHYFLECPLYNDSRNELLQNLNRYTNTHNHISIDTFLYGCLDCGINTNRKYLKIFIYS